LGRKKGKSKLTSLLTAKKKRKKKNKMNIPHWNQRASKSSNLNDRVGPVPSAQVH